jgi:thiamine-phosphate pyrophosphorylase
MAAGDGGGSAGCRVYLITPPVLDPEPFAGLLAAALDAGDVAAVQLRLKDVGDDVWRRTIDVLRPVCQSRGVAFLLNDRADLVVATGCDGAHVGQDDMPAREVRQLMGPGLTLGVTCKGSRDLAMQAGEDGADYVAFGAFYPSTTKAVTGLLDPEILLWWSEMMELPSCAIGGITAENCAPLVRAGADFLAVVGCVWSCPDGPAAGVKALNAAIRGAERDVLGGNC